VGKRGRPRFKGHKRPLHSIEGKNQKGCLQWKAAEHLLQVRAGWTIGVQLPDLKKDEWLWTALAAPTKYCRVVWRQVRGRKRWYVQLIQEGLAPLKASLLARLAATGETGGIDIGPSNIAWVTATNAGLFRFCAEVERPHKAIRRLLRHIDRQRRTNNPDNYDATGQPKKGCRWKTSNSQRKAEIKLREAYRHEAAVRVNAHGRDINFLLSQALDWRDDGVSPKALQRMYGKSISVRAPGHFMSELTRKAARAGGARTKIEVRSLKTSQYDHPTDTFQKKKLSERWHVFRDGRGRVQRDIYSAFLARNSDGKTYQPCVLETAWQALAPTLRVTGWYEPQVARGGLADPRPSSASRQSDSSSKLFPKRPPGKSPGYRLRSGPVGAVRPMEAPA
jgi:putative transposase